MDVRTEHGNGKLLFQWNPESKVISIVRKGKIYRIRLLFDENSGYEILESADKNGGRDPPNKI